jgi:hypothetical protein
VSNDETNQQWQARIRARDGQRCVKCGYHHATPIAYCGGVMLCQFCTAEHEMLGGQTMIHVTDGEWLRLPSLRQFILDYRKTR